MLQRLVSAVQLTDAWRELCIFRKSGAKWTIGVLPPADSGPDVGYAEFASWVPGGTQVLVVREATVRRASEPHAAFRRWQDPSWQQQTLSLR
jgi:hypothetical protein